MAIRSHTSLEGCEPERRGNHEGVLLSPAELAERFPDDRDAVARTAEIAERLRRSTSRRSSATAIPTSPTAPSRQSRCCAGSATAPSRSATPRTRQRRGGAARERLDDELALIDHLGLAGFFLLHHEVLELAREVALEVRGPDSPRAVLPPGRGRGSSVGSIVCYLTGLSHVDPVHADLSLGRFLNRELAAVPDVDLDFPRDIREKLIVAVTERYGREHAALVAAFATYRSRGAIRDVGKALGLPHAELERLARVSDGWNARRVAEELALVPGARGEATPRRAGARSRT